MNRASLYATLVGVSLTGVTALSISAVVESPRSLMAPVDYEQAKRAIESRARLALGSCRGLDGRERSVCQAQARADERVGKAELEAAYRGTVAAASAARVARAKARFDVARAKCSESRGGERIACVRSAHSEKDKAPADAKVAAS
jgi:hypothetical protein